MLDLRFNLQHDLFAPEVENRHREGGRDSDSEPCDHLTYVRNVEKAALFYFLWPIMAFQFNVMKA